MHFRVLAVNAVEVATPYLERGARAVADPLVKDRLTLTDLKCTTSFGSFLVAMCQPSYAGAR